MWSFCSSQRWIRPFSLPQMLNIFIKQNPDDSSLWFQCCLAPKGPQRCLTRGLWPLFSLSSLRTLTCRGFTMFIDFVSAAPKTSVDLFLSIGRTMVLWLLRSSWSVLPPQLNNHCFSERNYFTHRLELCCQWESIGSGSYNFLNYKYSNGN